MLGVVVCFVLPVLSSFWFSMVSSPPLDGSFSSFLSSSSLISVSCVFLLWVPPSDPLSLVSLFGSFPSWSSFCSRWRPLVGLKTFRLLLLVSSLGVALFLSPFLVFGRSLSLPFILSLALFCCGLFGILWALLRLSSSCVLFGLFSCASLMLLLFLPVLVPSLSLHTLPLTPFLHMPSVSSSVMSWLGHFLQLVALFLLLLARPTLLPLPFRLDVLVLPFVRVGCMVWRRLVFSPQCSFVFLPCGPFLIFSFRLSSFSHSDVQFSSSSVYGLGYLFGEVLSFEAYMQSFLGL